MLFGTKTQKPYASEILNDKKKSSLSGLRKDEQLLNHSEPLNKVLCEEDAQTILEGQRRLTW